ncbi:MAG: outer membrane beta-barrel protein, partial [Candidatus Krumholzibacteriota bacterium]|nr:outer membrane beta-barrel protein [Candidatus Krumholzibacteriota bacterium]
MKRIVVTAALCLLLAAPAAAQSVLDDIDWSVDAGIAMPTGDFGKAANTGFCFGVNGFWSYTERLLFGGRIAYDRWGVDEDMGGRGWDVEGHFSAIEIVPQVRYLFTDDATQRANFFGQAGIGFYRFAFDLEYDSDLTDDTWDSDDAEIDLGIALGGGVTIDTAGGRSFEIRP